MILGSLLIPLVKCSPLLVLQKHFGVVAKAGTKFQEVVTILSSSVFVTVIIIHYYGKY